MKIKTLSFIKKTKESTNFLGKILMELPTTVAIFSALFLLSKILTGELYFDRTSLIDEGIKGVLIGESKGVEKMKDAVN